MPAKIPSYDRLMIPLMAALRALGGSGSVEEIYNKVVELEKFPEDVLSPLHDSETSNDTEIGYRLAWARTYLKKYGLLDNSSRGVWSLNAKGLATEKLDHQEVVRFVRAMDKKSRTESKGEPVSPPGSPEGDDWKQKLISILIQKLSPAAFERLVQRLLRESGFTQVEVTGRSGDGGIDGRGIARINGFMSFHVLFQCKRYKGSVSSGEVRDFRGAMVGRADKGLFITTGSFSPSAVKEATRDGAPPIDLVNGEELAERLKSLDLGVQRETVEVVKIDERWFDGI